ncbi:MAG: methionyl-tRNA formyltransferase [Candidatus Deianiraeaceae bacterium]|jgi:methionyl-tRNA formyltransferase
MKIAFFGTSMFGVPTLNALCKNFSVEFVVTGQAKQAKRGQKIINTPIFDCATQNGIKRIYTPEKLTPEFEEYLSEIDYGVVVSYGKILTQNILSSVQKDFINVHPSDLPLFRGAAPIERTIESGLNKTAVCVIRLQRELDAGDILAKKDYTISNEENAIDLHTKFSHIGADLVIDFIQNGTKNVIPQRHQCATYAPKISKQEVQLYLQTNEMACNIFNKIRAFASYGYCYFIYNNKRVKIISAEITEESKTKLDIQCTDGFVTPIIIRPEGKGNINTCDYLLSCD